MRTALLCLVALVFFMVGLGAWSLHPYAAAAVAACGPFLGAAVIAATGGQKQGHDA